MFSLLEDAALVPCTTIEEVGSTGVGAHHNDVTLGNKDRHPLSTCIPWMCSPICLASFRQQLSGQMARYST